MMSFEDLILIFYIWIPNTTIEGTMKKKSNSNNTLPLLLGVWPKHYGFSIHEHFSRVLDCTCTPRQIYSFICWPSLFYMEVLRKQVPWRYQAKGLPTSIKSIFLHRNLLHMETCSKSIFYIWTTYSTHYNYWKTLASCAV